MIETQKLKTFFVHDLQWGWDYQAQAVFHFLLQANSHTDHGVVLDVGAVFQRYKAFFADCLYVALEHPDSGAANKGINEFDILADSSLIPLCNESVDLVLSTSSLEHMHNPQAFFEEAYRVLKPSGALFIHVPFCYWEHEVPYDYQRFTRYGLAHMYKSALFKSFTIKPASSCIYTGTSLLMAAVHLDSNRFRKTILSKLYRRTLVALARILSMVLLHCLDQKPDDTTSLPIGWLAKGFKPGTAHINSKYKNAAAFNNSCYLNNQDSSLCKGKIICNV